MTREESLIISLREKKMSFNEISNELGLKRHRVRYVCRKYNVGGGIRGEHNKPLEERRYNFARKFEAKFSGFKYHSEFKSVDENFKSECIACGFVQERNAQCLRRDKEVSCLNCSEIRKKVREMIMESRTKLNEMVWVIKRNAMNELREVINLKMKETPLLQLCFECGSEFDSLRKRKYCSDGCLNRVANRRKELRRRNLLGGDLDITIERLIKKENNICYLCGNKCDRKDYIISDEGHYIVGRSYPSIEHVIPLSKGGTHTWGNVRLAHHYCNTLKSDNELLGDGKQLALTL